MPKTPQSKIILDHVLSIDKYKLVLNLGISKKKKRKILFIFQNVYFIR